MTELNAKSNEAIGVLRKSWGLFIACWLLIGCEQRLDLAPIVELTSRSTSNQAKSHVVQPGETLYAISFRYDRDYRQLAAINQLHSPYTLHIGQILYLMPGYAAARKPASLRVKTPANKTYVSSKKSAPAVRNQPEMRLIKRQLVRWQWPVQGRIAVDFAPQQGKKGITIAGVKGERIQAAAPGIVAYAGNGLPGYGNLIIIKHDKQFLTAYGHNLRNLVRVGQVIHEGQAIAEMGMVDRHYWGVHFEVRKTGKPINPLYLLPKKA